MHDDFFGVLATCPCVFDGRLLRPADIAALAAAAQQQWPLLAARQAHQTPPGRLTNTPPDRVGADRPRPCSRNDPAVPSVQDVQRSLAFV